MARSKSPAAVAEALLDAHVRFLAERLTGDGLQSLLEREVDAILAGATHLTLDAAVTRAAVKGAARRYAAELELGGGIPELVGEIAQAVHAHDVLNHTRFGELLSDRKVREFVDKALELKSLRERIVHQVAHAPVYTRFISDLLYEGIRGYLADNAVTRRIPGAGSMLKLGQKLVSKAAPRLEAAVEEGLRAYVERSVRNTAERSAELFLQQADDAALRALVLDTWSQLKRQKVSSLRQDVTSLDIEEFFVIGYESWRELRQTRIYVELIEAGIDRFFDKYGARPLSELLADIGIGRAEMLDEAQRFGPHALAALRQAGLLEGLLRRNLEEFYRSEEALAVLGG